MKNLKKLKKRKLQKAIRRRAKSVEKYRVDTAFRNIFVNAGIVPKERYIEKEIS